MLDSAAVSARARSGAPIHIPAMTGRAWVLLALMALLFGGAFPFIELGLRAADPVTLMVLRIGIAALALTVLLYTTGRKLPRGMAVWRALTLMGLFNTALPFALIMWGQTHLTAGLSAILNATAPLFTALLAHLFTEDEKLSARRLAGLVIGLAGLTLVMGAKAFDGPGHDFGAQLAVLGAALSYAVAGIYGRRSGLGRLEPVEAAAGMLLAAAALGLPLAFLLGTPAASLIALSRDGVAQTGVAGLALLCTALTYPLYFFLLRTVGATNVLLVALLAPAAGVILGVVLLSESLAWTSATGLGVMLLGLTVMSGRLLSRPSRA